MMQMTWCYETLSNIANDFNFLTGFYLSTVSKTELQKHAVYLILKNNNGLSFDIIDDIKYFKYQAETIASDLRIANYLDLLNAINFFFPGRQFL